MKLSTLISWKFSFVIFFSIFHRSSTVGPLRPKPFDYAIDITSSMREVTALGLSIA